MDSEILTIQNEGLCCGKSNCLWWNWSEELQNAPVAINRSCEGVALNSDDEKEEFKD